MERVIIQNLTDPHLVKKETTASEDTLMLITVFTKACHSYLSRARIIESKLPRSVSVTATLSSTCHRCLDFPSGHCDEKCRLSAALRLLFLHCSASYMQLSNHCLLILCRIISTFQIHRTWSYHHSTQSQY